MKRKVIIALPGKMFSDNFVISLINSIYSLMKIEEYDITISPGYSSFVPFTRMKTLGLDTLRTSEQKPFNDADYDVWVTIDSDIVWKPSQLMELIEDAMKFGAVSGLYRMTDLTHYACVRHWDTEYFKKNGNFQFMTPDSIQEWKNQYPSTHMMEVVYNGLGFAAFRKDVLNQLEYPYFWHELITIPLENSKMLKDMCSEDVAFCKNITKKGIPFYVNTNIIVGHEKPLVI